MSDSDRAPVDGMGDHYMLRDVTTRSATLLREYDQLADRIAAEVTGPVLDWGCGFGLLAARLAERGVHVVAIDYRPDISAPGDYALTRYPGLTAYQTNETVRLPYGDGMFSAVVSMGTLEHVNDPVGSLSEIRRVLAPAGRFYVYKLPNRFSYIERIGRYLGRYYHGALPDDRTYTRRTAQELLGRSGFTVTEVRLANILPLTEIGLRVKGRAADAVWNTNRVLSRIPGLNRVANNIEVVATRS